MKDEIILLYGDETFFLKIKNILNKLKIHNVEILSENEKLEKIKTLYCDTKILFSVIHGTNQKKLKKNMLHLGLKEENISFLDDFSTFMGIIDFAENEDSNKIEYFLNNINIFKKLYTKFLQKKFNKNQRYDVAILLNMVNFRTALLDIATCLEKKYNVVTLFLDDKEKFEYKNKINLDTKKNWNNAIFNARLKYLNYSDIVLSPSEDCFGKTSINCMHNLNYKPVDKDKLFQGIATPHYHLIPTKTMFKLHQKILEKNRHKLKHDVTLIPAGYPKLDKLINELHALKHVTKDSICYAPTMLMHNKDFTDTLSLQNGEFIIEYLLETFKDYKIIFRPHPNVKIYNHQDAGLEYIDNIIEKFKDNDRFIYDNSKYYLETFARTKILISDYSSIMHTFSFSTLIPFISLSTKEFSKLYKKNLGIKDDRHKSGKIIHSINQMKSTIADIIENKKKYERKIKKIRSNEVYNVQQSVEYITKNFRYILEKKKNKEWFYAQKQ